MRVGIGYDLHRLNPAETAESSIVIGGVPIPCPYRIEAHSDGDVLLHALVDACLGALALGDIGEWFPDTKADNAGRSSRDFVRIVREEVEKRGWRIAQVDSVLLLQAPKISAFKARIQASVAELTGLELTDVGVKAKTMEGLGPIGEKRALAAHVIVSLQPRG